MNKLLRVAFATVFCLCAMLVSAQQNRDAEGIDRALDSILAAAQSASGKGKADITANVAEIRRLLRSTGTSALPVMNEQDFVQLISLVKRSPDYGTQKAVVGQYTANYRLWMQQLQRLAVCVVDTRSRRDLISTLFPLVLDPENIDQLINVYGAAPINAEPAPPAPLPQVPVAKVYEDAEVAALVTRIKAAWPYKGQKILIQNLPSDRKLKMAHIKKILTVIDFMNDQKDVLTLLLPTVADPENIDLLFDTFWTSSDKEFLNSLVKKR